MALAILAARSSPDLAQAAMAGAQYASVADAAQLHARQRARSRPRRGAGARAGGVRSARNAGVFGSVAARIPASTRPTRPRTCAPTRSPTNASPTSRDRVDTMPYRQVPDSLDFQFVRARLQVAQLAPRDAVERFTDTLREKKTVNEAVSPLRIGRGPPGSEGFRTGEKRDGPAPARAARQSQRRSSFRTAPCRRGRAHQGARKCIRARSRSIPGAAHWSMPTRARCWMPSAQRRRCSVIAAARLTLPPDYRLYQLQARAHAALGQRLQQHRAQAEAYVLRGSVPAAIEQLQIGLQQRRRRLLSAL